MRDSIAGLWLMSIMIVFMLVLIAFISISLNYSIAYKLKSSIVTKIEQYDGFNMNTISEIEGLIDAYGYKSAGYCRVDTNGYSYLGVSNGQVTTDSKNLENYCVYRSTSTDNGQKKYYYRVTVFFGFTLPVLGEIYTFRVSGETAPIYYPSTTDLFGGISAYTTTTTTGTTGVENPYTINLTVVNGSTSTSTITLGSNSKQKIVSFSPNTYYKLVRSSVSCTNGYSNYSVSSNSNKINFKYPSTGGETTCTITMKANIVEVTLNVYVGNVRMSDTKAYYSSSPTRQAIIEGAYGSTISYKYSIPTGYELDGSPTCGTYSNGTWSVPVTSTENFGCSLYVKPKIHTIKVYMHSTLLTQASIAYGQTKNIEVWPVLYSYTSNYSGITKYYWTDVKKVYCQVRVNGRYTGKTYYSVNEEYILKYTLENDGDVVCRVSDYSYRNVR